MSDVQGAAPAAPALSPTPTDSAPAPQPVTIVEKTTPSMEDTMREVYTKLNPLRAEDGKYTEKNPVAELDKPATEDVKPAKSADEKGQTQTEAEPALVDQATADVPQFLPAAIREDWAKTPPALRDWINKAQAKNAELGRTAKSSEELRNVIDRHRPSLRGASEVEALDKLFAANAYLERSPTDAIRWLADAYRVDLNSLVTPRNDSESPSPESADTRALKAELAQVRRELNETKTHVLTREQREAQTQQSTLSKLIDEFKADPARSPYWDKLEDDIHAQVVALRTQQPDLTPDKLLQKAYDRALRVNEEVSKQVEAETKATEAKKKAAEDAKKAEEAKKLASMNTRSRESAPGKPSGSWEDTMREVGKKLMRTG